MAKMTKEVAKVLARVRPEERKKVLNAAHMLHQDRIKRALKWREILGIKEGNRLVDDASDLP